VGEKLASGTPWAAVLPRSDFPSLDEAIYLNQASLGLIGRPAVEAMHAFLDDVGRHGNLHLTDEDEVAFLGTLRGRAAEILGTGEGQVALLSGASELLGFSFRTVKGAVPGRSSASSLPSPVTSRAACSRRACFRSR
jgi:selenocysteine lyase/cysteine desulfurase